MRFRNNSFAADNHDAGRVQVEIITRPGLTAWSGNANLGLRSDVLNARNAFARAEMPEQFRRFNMSVRGPLVRNRTSLRINVDGNRSFDSGTIVALTPDGRVADQVRRPFEQTNFSARLDHGLTTNSTLRLEYRAGEDARRNLGVGNFSLLERAYSQSSSRQEVRGAVQTVLGRATLNELRVQFATRESIADSANQGVSIVVIDAFSRGGAGVSNRGTRRTLEVEDNYDFAVGKQRMRVGALLEAGNYRNFDARNAAGTFTFGSLDAFAAGLPNTFTQRLGQVDTAFTQYQLGIYWQDDVRLHPSLSVSVGVRQEMQNHVGDHVNPMPRAWIHLERRRVEDSGARRLRRLPRLVRLEPARPDAARRRCDTARSARAQSGLPRSDRRRLVGRAARRPRAGGARPEAAVCPAGVCRRRAPDHADAQRAGVGACSCAAATRCDRATSTRPMQPACGPSPTSARSRRSSRPAGPPAIGSTCI